MNSQKPKEVFKQLEKDNFPTFTRGDIVFTNNHRSLLARLIRFRGKVEGETPVCNHVEMYLLNGYSIGANRKVDINSLKRYFNGKHDVIVMHNKKISEEGRDKLVKEALRYLHKPYDSIGIVWQALDCITFSTFFSRVFNKKFFVYCSELLQRVYMTAVRRRISKKKVGAATPNNIFEFVKKHPNWECVFIMRK